MFFFARWWGRKAWFVQFRLRLLSKALSSVYLAVNLLIGEFKVQATAFTPPLLLRSPSKWPTKAPMNKNAYLYTNFVSLNILILGTSHASLPSLTITSKKRPV